ncbi:MAG: HAD-IIIA family hydrolase [Ignavibacteria bacterium]|nr:HAD-IIIA family hydrolase [Ignavibacteria bacterium]
MASGKALFLDRDGVINRRIMGGYVRTPSEFVLLEAILPLLRSARSKGYLLILISNQQGVGKGLMSNHDLDVIHSFMQDLLAAQLDGRGLDDIRVCTDLDSAQSTRRKPAPGMLLEAIKEFDLAPSQCWFLGDASTDAQAGRAAGVKTALIGQFLPTEADVIIPDHSGIQALADLL